MLIERLLPLIGSFRDQVVLVTGASSGIGRETALSFARQGASVALMARRRALLDEIGGSATAAGGHALSLPIDVTDARAIRAAVGRVRRKWGRIDILVNNAGVLVPSTIEALRPQDFEAMWRVNVLGALFMMQAVLPTMRRQGQGTIINVASLAGRRGVTPLGGYCATKFALVGLTEALRTELDTAIHVGLVMPGVVDTPMAQQVNQDALLPTWPAFLNMPPEWVVAAILLSVRFRLREMLGGLAPAISDTMIRWTTAAGRLITGGKTARKTAHRGTPPMKLGRTVRGRRFGRP
jgi:NAD(P)-dependent dehydrogenase (short-subunit alcohol dehydrogenase family)